MLVTSEGEQNRERERGRESRNVLPDVTRSDRVNNATCHTRFSLSISPLSPIIVFSIILSVFLSLSLFSPSMHEQMLVQSTRTIVSDGILSFFHHHHFISHSIETEIEKTRNTTT